MKFNLSSLRNSRRVKYLRLFWGVITMNMIIVVIWFFGWVFEKFSAMCLHNIMFILIKLGTPITLKLKTNI